MSATDAAAVSALLASGEVDADDLLWRATEFARAVAAWPEDQRTFVPGLGKWIREGRWRETREKGWEKAEAAMPSITPHGWRGDVEGEAARLRAEGADYRATMLVIQHYVSGGWRAWCTARDAEDIPAGWAPWWVPVDAPPTLQEAARAAVWRGLRPMEALDRLSEGDQWIRETVTEVTGPRGERRWHYGRRRRLYPDGWQADREGSETRQRALDDAADTAQRAYRWVF